MLRAPDTMAEPSGAPRGVVPSGDASRVVGDLPGFLGAYYRLVAVEDLIAAGPVRLAATAAFVIARAIG